MPEVTGLQRKHFTSDLDEIAREGARRGIPRRDAVERKARTRSITDCTSSNVQQR
jgi:hypothetical protein